jgi:uncharacterized membrane protein YdjX (TVP38/TMEM64 family)
VAAASFLARYWRLVVAGMLAATVVGLYFAFNLGDALSLTSLKLHQTALQQQFADHPIRTAALFFALYLTVTALSVPGTALLTLSAGAIFGWLWGTLIVSFSSALGATLAFLISRFLLRDWVQAKFGAHLSAFNRGVEKDGAFYVVSLGLMPIFPYFVINLVMGLTPMRTTTFYWASQAGMLIETILVVNAGTQLAKVESLAGLLSPTLLTSLALIGLVPFVLKWLLTHEKMPQRWRRRQDH